jgi:hypothetical protein
MKIDWESIGFLLSDFGMISVRFCRYSTSFVKA